MTELMKKGKISDRSKVVFINDGSTDRTWEIICQLHEEDKLFWGINLSRNRGHQNADVYKRQVLDAMHLTSQGFSAKQIKDTLEAKKMETGIYIMVDTLKYLRKGGRITPAAAALGTVLRLKPVLQIHGARLDAFAKARTVQQAKALMINALKNDIEQCFGRRAVSYTHLRKAFRWGTLDRARI